MIRQPVGVCAIICPVQLPRHDPLLVPALRPGLRQHLHRQAVREGAADHAEDFPAWSSRSGLPKGVVNLVNGAKEAVDAILDHPPIRAISFVGSTPVARYIYSRGAANGKRVQAQGGAKNPVVILPDADMEMTAKIIADSAFGCAGQRCLAASLAITVGEARHDLHRSDLRRRRQPRGRLRPGRRRADGTGHHPAEQGAHRGADRSEASTKAPRCWWMGATQRSRATRRATSSARPILDDVPAGQRGRPHRDLRPGAGPDARRTRSTRPSRW